MKSSDMDEMLGAPARLAILATVATLPSAESGGRWTFTALRQETGLADGNLYVQARKLTGAGYLSSRRIRQGNRSVTCFDLTDIGRRALRSLVDRLEEALESRSGFQDRHESRTGPGESADDSRVW